MTAKQLDSAIANIDSLVEYYYSLERTLEQNLARQHAAIVAEFPHFGDFSRPLTDSENERAREIESPIRDEMPEDISDQIFDARTNAARAIVQYIESAAGKDSGLNRHIENRFNMVESRIILWWERGMQGSIPTMQDSLAALRARHDEWKIAVNN